MADEEERTVLRFYLSPQWDALSQTCYVYAPDDWADMSEKQREEFLDEQSRDWAYQKFDYGAAEYTAEDRAARASSRFSRWESGSPDEIEEWF